MGLDACATEWPPGSKRINFARSDSAQTRISKATMRSASAAVTRGVMTWRVRRKSAFGDQKRALPTRNRGAVTAGSNNVGVALAPRFCKVALDRGESEP